MTIGTKAPSSRAAPLHGIYVAFSPSALLHRSVEQTQLVSTLSVYVSSEHAGPQTDIGKHDLDTTIKNDIIWLCLDIVSRLFYLLFLKPGSFIDLFVLVISEDITYIIKNNIHCISRYILEVFLSMQPYLYLHSSPYWSYLISRQASQLSLMALVSLLQVSTLLVDVSIPASHL